MVIADLARLYEIAAGQKNVAAVEQIGACLVAFIQAETDRQRRSRQ